ncbi:MAG: hypothetical protein IMW89_06045 [Ktedonobacteraceae bacterium]|nr:hypothetical protein [Ktedonobacteraceae bacterium]
MKRHFHLFKQDNISEKQTTGHEREQQEPEKQKELKKIVRRQSHWIPLPSRERPWFSGCSGWVTYKWYKNEYRPW